MESGTFFKFSGLMLTEQCTNAIWSMEQQELVRLIVFAEAIRLFLGRVLVNFSFSFFANLGMSQKIFLLHAYIYKPRGRICTMVS